MSIGLGIPNHSNLQDYAIYFKYHNQKMLGDQIGESPLNEMLIAKLEYFLPGFNLSFSRGGGHVMRVPYRAWGDMIKRGAIPHLPLED